MESMPGWFIMYQNSMTLREPEQGTRGGVASLAAAKGRLLASLSRQVTDLRVIRAMADVPRDAFIPPKYLPMAYDDCPLPIGEGQTISQPLIVALMTEALQLQGDETVLEMGTGSGYHASILSRLVPRVVSVERKAPLFAEAQRRLAGLGIHNVAMYLAETTLGWPEEAPFGAILVTAAAPPAVPMALIEQLREGGRLVIPCGVREQQELLRITRLRNGLRTERLGACAFVPLIGPGAWSEEA